MLCHNTFRVGGKPESWGLGTISSASVQDVAEQFAALAGIERGQTDDSILRDLIATFHRSDSETGRFV